MPLRLLFVNPPIYDFTAYDFWLRPYGLLGVAGRLASHEASLFDFLGPAGQVSRTADGRGRFLRERVRKPEPLGDIPRPYHRYGAPPGLFRRFLRERGPFDAILVGSGMTYWYPGVKEVIEAARSEIPASKIVLGGIYPTLVPAHALSLEADLVVVGRDLRPLEVLLGGRLSGGPPLWGIDGGGLPGVVSISRGCPFSCTYCASGSIDGAFGFKYPASLEGEIGALSKAGKEQVAFYDDALLYRFGEGLGRFLEAAAGKGFVFHTPNGLHARYVDREVAGRLREGGFADIFLSLESVDGGWQEKSGGKLEDGHFASAVEGLRAAGFGCGDIFSYILLGRPDIPAEAVREAVLYLRKLGVRPFLSEFSPIPGTPDGDRCATFGDLSEPLNHNKAAFTIRSLGEKSYQEIKAFAKEVFRDR